MERGGQQRVYQANASLTLLSPSNVLVSTGGQRKGACRNSPYKIVAWGTEKGTERRGNLVHKADKNPNKVYQNNTTEW